MNECNHMFQTHRQANQYLVGATFFPSRRKRHRIASAELWQCLAADSNTLELRAQTRYKHILKLVPILRSDHKAAAVIRAGSKMNGLGMTRHLPVVAGLSLIWLSYYQGGHSANRHRFAESEVRSEFDRD